MAGDARVRALLDAVNGERLWRRHMEIAAIGATGLGGVDRQALSPEDAEARRWMLAWAGRLGFAVAADGIGNLFIRRPGSDAAADPVVAGSHLDTQPAGGNFDGIFGVLAAVEVLEAASDAGIATPRPLEVAVWTNEEGSRFQPTTMGSAVFAGSLPLDVALDTTDSAATSLRQALAETMQAAPVAARRAFGFPMAAFVEAHIEQGPVLEATGNTIGVVTTVQGLRWFQVEIEGEEAHAGTTPRANRRDAVAAAVRMVTALEALMLDETDTVRFTVGRFEVSPNSPNTVPGRVLFTIDFRHPESAVLQRLGDRVAPLCREHAGACAVTVTETMNSPPTAFDASVCGMIRDAAQAQGLAHRDMVSGATHDAKFMAGLCPAAMIFVPCERGISHSEAERAAPADLTAGTRVLAEVMLRLADGKKRRR